METSRAFVMGQLSRHSQIMVFDWHKAASIIRDEKPKFVSAGLRGDWEYTGGDIFLDGKPVLDSYTYLASTWAKPEINVDGDIRDCYVMESETAWDADTKWPESALEILGNNSQVEA